MHVGRAVRAWLYGLPVATGAAANAGDITGSVSFSGAPPQRAKTPITIDQYICGKEKDAEDLVLGPKGGVQHAVVWIENPPAGEVAGGGAEGGNGPERLRLRAARGRRAAGRHGRLP